MNKDEWLRFTVALSQAVGAVHTAVAVTLVALGKVPVALALAAGGGVFFFTGRAQAPTPARTAAVRYGAPMALAVLLKLLCAGPADLDAALGEGLKFLLAVWAATPVPCYLLAAVYALAMADHRRARSPFDPPGR